jgi:hypothetical protein
MNRDVGQAIESDPVGVLLAKWRRDAFISRLQRLPNVVEVIESGSLARDTYIGPVHDIDLIVVFDSSVLKDYGMGTESTDAVLWHLQNILVQQLHPLRETDQPQPAETGEEEPLLRNASDAEIRTHVVRCLNVSTGPFSGIIPSAPPVDVMPAVRLGSHLLVPARRTGWIDVDPEKFKREIQQRQREWEYFAEVTKMVKAWSKRNDLGLKSIAIEAMVLKYSPRPRPFETLSRREAVARFFEQASAERITSLSDPAGRSGEIDPHMDYTQLRQKLNEAAGLARQAMDAERAGETLSLTIPDSEQPDVYWWRLLGENSPEDRVSFWRAPIWEPRFGESEAEASDAAPSGIEDQMPPPFVPSLREQPSRENDPSGTHDSSDVASRVSRRSLTQAFTDGVGGIFDIFGGIGRQASHLPTFEDTLAKDARDLCRALGLAVQGADDSSEETGQ